MISPGKASWSSVGDRQVADRYIVAEIRDKLSSLVAPVRVITRATRITASIAPIAVTAIAMASTAIDEVGDFVQQ